MLAHLLALGRATFVPWSMIVVNYLAICALAFSSALFAQRLGWPAVYGLGIAFLPAALLGLARDLPDPLAISLMVGSLFLLHSRRIGWGAAVLALAVLPARDNGAARGRACSFISHGQRSASNRLGPSRCDVDADSDLWRCPTNDVRQMWRVSASRWACKPAANTIRIDGSLCALGLSHLGRSVAPVFHFSPVLVLRTFVRCGTGAARGRDDKSNRCHRWDESRLVWICCPRGLFSNYGLKTGPSCGPVPN